jgi:hypothetical protein
MIASSNAMNYRDKCLEAFNRDVGLGQNYLFWSLPRESPETEQLFNAMGAIEWKLFAKYLQQVKAESIEGAIVELGVFEGNALAWIVDSCEQLGLRRETFGFDSFEGLPEVTSYDEFGGWQKGQYAAKLDAVAQRVKADKRPNVHLIKGWFRDTLTANTLLKFPALRKISFARVDCDLYQSAVECLEFLKGRLTNGAFLIFDDWSHREDQGETKAFFDYYERIKRDFRFEHLASLGRGSLHLRIWRR